MTKNFETHDEYLTRIKAQKNLDNFIGAHAGKEPSAGTAFTFVNRDATECNFEDCDLQEYRKIAQIFVTASKEPNAFENTTKIIKPGKKKYDKLRYNLPEGTHLRQLKLTRSSRLFYYMVRNVWYIIAIKVTHL